MKNNALSSLPGADIADIHFVPYEDIMGIGHSHGVSSIIVPGPGEPNFDSFESNPYQTNRQIREATVHSLLEKVFYIFPIKHLLYPNHSMVLSVL